MRLGAKISVMVSSLGAACCFALAADSQVAEGAVNGASEQNGAVAEGNGSGQPAEPELSAKEKAEKLIPLLAGNNYQERIQAHIDLWELGMDALPAVEQAMLSSEPEIRLRATELFQYISAGVLADSDDEIKSMVMSYNKANVRTKVNLLNQLAQKQAYWQIFHLYEREKDEFVRANMKGFVQRISLVMARQAVAAGDLARARMVLEKTPASEATSISLAWLLRETGELESAIEVELQKPADADKSLLKGLYRVSGQLEKVAEVAAAEKNLEDQVLVSLLQNDPEPLMDWLLRDHRTQNSLASLSLMIQRLRWQGKFAEADELAAEIQDNGEMIMRDNDVLDHSYFLLANGYLKEAKKFFGLYNTYALDSYYDATMQLDHQLDLMGIEPDSLDAWVETQMSVIKDTEDKADIGRLLEAACFFDSIGQTEEANRVLQPYLQSTYSSEAKDAENPELKDLEGWLEMLSDMLGDEYRLHDYVHNEVLARGNSEEYFSAVVAELYSRSADDLLWSYLLKNSESAKDAYESLAILRGYTRSSDEKARGLQEKLLEEFADLPAGDQAEYKSELAVIALYRRDVESVGMLLEDIGAEKITASWNDTHELLEAEKNGWRQSADDLAEMVKEFDGASTGPDQQVSTLIQWHIASALCKDQVMVDESTELIKLFILGDVSLLQDIAVKCYSRQLYDLAEYWWQQAFLCAGIWDNSAVARLQTLLRGYGSWGSGLDTPKDWQKNAAISEATISFLSLRGNNDGGIVTPLYLRHFADMYHGLALAEAGNMDLAIKYLDDAHRIWATHAGIADHFFPQVMKFVDADQLDAWVEKSYQPVLAMTQKYPDAHNLQNGAAWILSRAQSKPAAAMAHVGQALRIRPRNCAYLDTQAEVYFAQGNRDEAMRYSRMAMNSSISYSNGRPWSDEVINHNTYYQLVVATLNERSGLEPQYLHFQNDPLPAGK